MSGSISLLSLTGITILVGWYLLVFQAIRRMRQRRPIDGTTRSLIFVLLIATVLLLGLGLVVALSFDK